MHFSWTSRELDGLSGIATTPGDYDGVPIVSSLLLGSAPERADPNLIAVASALAFEAFVADTISLEKPVLPLVADALADFFAPLRVRCLNIDHRSARMSEGAGIFDVFGAAENSPNDGQQGEKTLSAFRVHLRDNFESVRGFANQQDLYLPTNASVISPRGAEDSRSIFPHVASVLMLAGEFGIREIRLHGSLAHHEDHHLVRARDLLRAVNRELIWN